METGIRRPSETSQEGKELTVVSSHTPRGSRTWCHHNPRGGDLPAWYGRWESDGSPGQGDRWLVSAPPLSESNRAPFFWHCSGEVCSRQGHGPMRAPPPDGPALTWPTHCVPQWVLTGAPGELVILWPGRADLRRNWGTRGCWPQLAHQEQFYCFSRKTHRSGTDVTVPSGR